MRLYIRYVFLLACPLSLTLTDLGEAEEVMRVHFIDVGQGDATLIEFPCAAMLIDTGGERWPEQEWKKAKYDSNKELVEYLESFFKSRPDLKEQLDLLVLTHPHKDHTRGVDPVVRTYQPKNVIHNGKLGGSGGKEQQIARDYIDENDEAKGYYILNRHINKETGLTNDIIDPIGKCGEVDPVIRVLWGQVLNNTGWDHEDFGDGNNHSLVVRVDFGEASVLFTGDLEEAEEDGDKAGIEHLIDKYRGTDLLDADVYQVGHHGSHNGTSPALLEVISPKISVISAGPACQRTGYSAWSHAHPRTETINELNNAVALDRQSGPKDVLIFRRWQSKPYSVTMNKAIYSTGWDGDIVLEAKANGWWDEASLSGSPACLAK